MHRAGKLPPQYKSERNGWYPQMRNGLQYLRISRRYPLDVPRPIPSSPTALFPIENREALADSDKTQLSIPKARFAPPPRLGPIPLTHFKPHCGLPIFAIGDTTNTAPGPPKTPRPLSRQHPIARRIAARHRRPEHLLTPSDAARTSHPSGDSTSVRSEIRERDSGGWVARRERWVSLMKAVDTSWTVTPWRSGINLGSKSVCVVALSSEVSFLYQQK